MSVQQPVRDRDLSLQQSAVHEALGGNSRLDQEQKTDIELKASQRAQKLQKKLEAPTASAPADAAPPAADDAGNLGPLRFAIRDYTWSDPNWIKTAWIYAKYYVISRLPPTYRNWRGLIQNDLNFGVIKYRLPPQCTVLMVGDWGTHMPDNAALLRQAVRKFRPQAIIHLGDVYYSGTVDECTNNVLNVIDRIYSDSSLGPRAPFFAIPGNHDYYSGGGGFYHTIDTVNSGIPGCTQAASFFCLRTADDKWQFLGMDTGFNDRVPTNQLMKPDGPDLHENEMEWHDDKLKLENFAGSTILLSHHQLISAKERLTKDGRQHLNERLYGKFGKYFDRVSAWFWGHEHNLIFFEDNMKIDDDKPRLQKGRLVGCSAYEENEGDDPYKINNSEARFVQNMKTLSQSTFKTGRTSFYNHAFAVLEVTPEKIMASYYEYPSWGTDNPPPSEPGIGVPLYTETLTPRTA
jgi:hypothetical protein